MDRDPDRARALFLPRLREHQPAARTVPCGAAGMGRAGPTRHGAVREIRPAPCVSNTPPAMEVWNCVRDEGRPFDAGDQEPAPNHRELLSLRAMVVSVAEKAGHDPVR